MNGKPCSSNYVIIKAFIKCFDDNIIAFYIKKMYKGQKLRGCWLESYADHSTG